MTTRRRLARQPASHHGDEAADDNTALDSRSSVSVPAPGDAANARRPLGKRGSLAAVPPPGPDVCKDDERTGRLANAPVENAGRHQSDCDQECDDGVLDGVRDAECTDRTSLPVHDPHTTPDQPRANTTPDNHNHAGEQQERSGLDARRRGWFWHWNSVVTQYAPLIGLKGVGLLNSYTVWTDRRDESPHRGYAFPSQQSEADFYGEERAELITINKILVALDLIEIRKEMLTRVDERGRRWRVPHNLYRVKDRPDGVDLRALDVLNVATLAQRDDAVFRYVRRVFSDRFRPIDGDNVWQQILTELRNDPTWRELQERTRAIEARASARTRAGHQSRTGANATKPQSALKPAADVTLDTPRPDGQALPDTQQTNLHTPQESTSVESTNTASDDPTTTVVDLSNAGSVAAVAASNTALAPLPPTSVASGSAGSLSVVGTGNTTYDQRVLTTTTTTTNVPELESARTPTVSDSPAGEQSRPASSPDRPSEVTTAATTLNGNQRLTGRRGRGPVQPDQLSVGTSLITQSRGGPVEGPLPLARNRGEYLGEMDERVATSRSQAAASGGTSTNQQLGAQVDARIEIEGDVDEQRSAGARAGGGAGERRLADPVAGGPMVDPGPLVISTFEAANDRRATPLERRLLAELERDADSAARAVGSNGADWIVAAMREAVASGSAFVAPKRIREIVTRWSTDPRHAPSSTAARLSPAASATVSGAATDAEAVEVRLPGGVSGDAVWATVLDELARVLDREAYDRLLAGSRITRYWRGTVEIRAANHAAAAKLSNEYRGLVERHLNSRLRRPVAVCFEADRAETSAVEQIPAAADPSAADVSQPLVVAAAEVEIGRQVWQSLLGDLARAISPSDLDRLAGVVVLGQDAGGAMLLGAPSPLARRLLDGRHRADVESSLAALLGQPAPVRVLDAGAWSIAPRE